METDEFFGAHLALFFFHLRLLDESAIGGECLFEAIFVYFIGPASEFLKKGVACFFI
jgi:hypothetical protein